LLFGGAFFDNRNILVKDMPNANPKANEILIKAL
jgi:hypothetical protein